MTKEDLIYIIGFKPETERENHIIEHCLVLINNNDDNGGGVMSGHFGGEY